MAKTKGVTPVSLRRSIRKTANDLYKQFLNAECSTEESDSSSEDEDDESFESPPGKKLS